MDSEIKNCDVCNSSNEIVWLDCGHFYCQKCVWDNVRKCYNESELIQC